MIALTLVVIPILLAQTIFWRSAPQPIRDSNVVDYSPVKKSSRRYQVFDPAASRKTNTCLSSDGYDSTESPVNQSTSIHSCNLLGPMAHEDLAEASISISENLTLPSSLEYEVIIDLPVGFFRLRRAILSSSSDFWTRSILQIALGYKGVNISDWQHPNGHYIGHYDMPGHVKNEHFIGARRDTQYQMPAGFLVPANMAYETCTLSDYNQNFFVLNMTTLTPDVPFGKKFLAKTQIIVVRTGLNRCRMICSVETEFPTGPPIGMKGQIKMGMKKGTLETFEKIGSHIERCAMSHE